MTAKHMSRLIGGLMVTFTATAPAQSYSVLKHFAGSDGANPGSTLVLAGLTVYVTTYSGGNSNFGTVFKLNTNGAGHTVLQHFLSPTHSNGAAPSAELVLSGSTLYGITEAGGTGAGTVFKLNTNGTGFSVLRRFGFPGENGLRPRAGLVLSGNTLYGTTYGKPPPPNPFSYGTVFKLNTNGSGYTMISDFTFTSPGDGKNPWGTLVLSGSTLYGTTFAGGIPNRGTVFKVSTNGTGYSFLKDFTGSDGAGPRGGLVLSGSTLYGVTQSGGTSNLGTVFKLNTNGTGHAVLKHFTGNDGANPVASLLLSGNTLYGTAYSGGGSNLGILYKVNTDGSGFAVLKEFTGSDGANPVGGLLMSGANLYGTTYFGGGSSNGVVFKLNLSPTVTVADAAGTLVLGWNAAMGLTYQLQYKTSLGSTTWSNLGGAILATNSTIVVSNSIGPDPQRLYRVMLVQ